MVRATRPPRTNGSNRRIVIGRSRFIIFATILFHGKLLNTNKDENAYFQKYDEERDEDTDETGRRNTTEPKATGTLIPLSAPITTDMDNTKDEIAPSNVALVEEPFTVRDERSNSRKSKDGQDYTTSQPDDSKEYTDINVDLCDEPHVKSSVTLHDTVHDDEPDGEETQLDSDTHPFEEPTWKDDGFTSAKFSVNQELCDGTGKVGEGNQVDTGGTKDDLEEEGEPSPVLQAGEPSPDHVISDEEEKDAKENPEGKTPFLEELGLEALHKLGLLCTPEDTARDSKVINKLFNLLVSLFIVTTDKCFAHESNRVFVVLERFR